MKLTWIYQYISLNQEVSKIIQTLKKCPKACIIPILDLEDSLQIPLDPEKTSILKARARKILGAVLKTAKEQDLPLKISLRINASETTEFYSDIRMLRELNPLVNWGSIYLPKVHSANILAKYIKSLEGLNYQELVAMAESQAFFDHCDEIIPMCKPAKINKVHFGHWDYFYDAGTFPIPLPDDKVLWAKASELIEKIEPAGLHYIHTPFCYLLQHDYFKSVVMYLESITSAPFGVTTLSFSQAQAVCKRDYQAEPVTPVDYSICEEEKIRIAKELVKFFTRPASPEYSFNIDTNIYRFYAPHEYLNAIRFTENYPDERN